MLNRSLISLGIIIGVPLSLLGQADYRPMVIENAHWTNCVTSTEEIWDCGVITEHLIQGDTLVDGVSYKKLYERYFLANGDAGGSWSSYDWPLLVVDETMIGLIREDVSGRKVYWRGTSGYGDCDSDSDEILLYDFALAMGDTLRDCLTEGFPPFVVTDIYSEELFGTERNVYELGNGNRLIEGLGYEGGLLSPPEIPISNVSTSILEHCVGVDMDCGVVKQDDMINPYREWHLLNRWFNLTTGSNGRFTTEHRFRDTIHYDSHLYFRLQNREQDENGPLAWGFTEYAYRQEGDQVYRYPGLEWQPNDGELLLYDFSIDSIGATFEVEGMLGFLSPMVVHLIDTVLLDNGEFRRRIHFHPNEFEEWEDWFWIEGVGANDHPFTPEYSFDDAIDGPRVKLQCFFHEPDLDNPVWRQLDADACDVYIVDNEEIEGAPNLLVYPNPSSDRLFVRNLLQGGYCELYTVNGRFLQRSDLNTDNVLELDLNTIPAGLYLWRVLNRDGQQLHAGRVIKQ